MLNRVLRVERGGTKLQLWLVPDETLASAECFQLLNQKPYSMASKFLALGSSILFLRLVSKACDVIDLCFFLFDKTGITGGPQAFLELRKESRPISLTNLFEVVADDLQKLNQNLLSVSCRELSHRIM